MPGILAGLFIYLVAPGSQNPVLHFSGSKRGLTEDHQH
jgi:hypothetical protein